MKKRCACFLGPVLYRLFSCQITNQRNFSAILMVNAVQAYADTLIYFLQRHAGKINKYKEQNLLSPVAACYLFLTLDCSHRIFAAKVTNCVFFMFVQLVSAPRGPSTTKCKNSYFLSILFRLVWYSFAVFSLSSSCRLSGYVQLLLLALQLYSVDFLALPVRLFQRFRHALFS